MGDISVGLKPLSDRAINTCDLIFIITASLHYLTPSADTGITIKFNNFWGFKFCHISLKVSLTISVIFFIVQLIFFQNDQRDVMGYQDHCTLNVRAFDTSIIGWIQLAVMASNFRYNDVIMGVIASQITSLRIFCCTVYSGRLINIKSASLAFVLGIHRWPVNSPHKWPVTQKKFPFDDVIILPIIAQYFFW